MLSLPAAALAQASGRTPPADPASPVAERADATVALPFADERSVAQTRFATAALTLLRE